MAPIFRTDASRRMVFHASAGGSETPNWSQPLAWASTSQWDGGGGYERLGLQARMDGWCNHPTLAWVALLRKSHRQQIVKMQHLVSALCHCATCLWLSRFSRFSQTWSRRGCRLAWTVKMSPCKTSLIYCTSGFHAAGGCTFNLMKINKDCSEYITTVPPAPAQLLESA